MMKPEVVNSRLRDVVEFEVDYIKKAYEHDLAEKDSVISQKDDEISMLKAKLKENGIEQMMLIIVTKQDELKLNFNI